VAAAGRRVAGGGLFLQTQASTLSPAVNAEKSGAERAGKSSA